MTIRIDTTNRIGMMLMMELMAVALLTDEDTWFSLIIGIATTTIMMIEMITAKTRPMNFPTSKAILSPPSKHINADSRDRMR